MEITDIGIELSLSFAKQRPSLTLTSTLGGGKNRCDTKLQCGEEKKDMDVPQPESERSGLTCTSLDSKFMAHGTAWPYLS